MDPRSTVIYYTANREEDRFEMVIRQQILRASVGLPIISVSQKPIDFGTNICVGEVGVSNQNAHRQIQIGAQAATTPFVHFAEADCLYPPEYFQYLPPDDHTVYRSEVYLYYLNSCCAFRHKASSECASVAGRDYVIDLIERKLSGRGIWRATLEHGKEVPITFSHKEFKIFTIEKPIINIKTRHGMHWNHKTDYEVSLLPYWGRPADIDVIFS